MNDDDRKALDDIAPRMAKIATYFGPEMVAISYQRGQWAVTPRLALLKHEVPGEYVVTHLGTGICTGDPFRFNHDTAINVCRELGDTFPDGFDGVAFGDQDGVFAHPDCDEVNAIAQKWHRRGMGTPMPREDELAEYEDRAERAREDDHGLH